jgi:putative DNA-invertase from lambdoid prophage Rac
VSTVQQAEEGESLDVQIRMIEGYCSMQGLTLAERGISGSIPILEKDSGYSPNSAQAIC